jgi:hypothetical protein
MRPSSHKFVTLVGVALLWLVASVVAHGHDEDMAMDTAMSAPSIARPTMVTASNNTVAAPESYWQLADHSRLMLAHIVLMTLGWLFILPIGLRILNFPSPHLLIFRRCYALNISIALQSSCPVRFPGNQCSWSVARHHLQRQHPRSIPQQCAS